MTEQSNHKKMKEGNTASFKESLVAGIARHKQKYKELTERNAYENMLACKSPKNNYGEDFYEIANQRSHPAEEIRKFLKINLEYTLKKFLEDPLNYMSLNYLRNFSIGDIANAYRELHSDEYGRPTRKEIDAEEKDRRFESSHSLHEDNTLKHELSKLWHNETQESERDKKNRKILEDEVYYGQITQQRWDNVIKERIGLLPRSKRLEDDFRESHSKPGFVRRFLNYFTKSNLVATHQLNVKEEK